MLEMVVSEQTHDDLDSKVFFTVPMTGLDTSAYRAWVDEQLLPAWAKRQSSKGEWQSMHTVWNAEGGFDGCVDGMYLHYKFYKCDGTSYGYFAKRGFFIRDHYSPEDVEKIQHVANVFEQFLIDLSIPYERENMKRP